MKKLLLLVVIPCALVLANSGVTVTQSTLDKVSLLVSLPTLTVTSQELGGAPYRKGRMFSELAFPEACISTEIGAPQLPVIREFIEIPFGAEVEVNAEVIKSEFVYPQYKVLPLQYSIPKSGPRPDFVLNEEVYNQDQFITFIQSENKSSVRARVEMIGEIRGHRVALVEIYPVAYNPKENVVEYASEIKVNLTLTGANLLLTEQMRNNYYSKPYDMMLRDLVKNYDAYVFTPPPDLPIGYLIIVPDEWVNNVMPLAQWRARKGFKVFVRTISQVGGSANNTVRNYILNAYNTWSIPPTSVLLVGDVDKIGYFVGTGTGTPNTDLNYSMMTTPDYLPDLDVSRASIANAAQLDSLVQKIIKYEKNQWISTNEWLNKSYFIASSDGSDHQVTERTHNYCMGVARRFGVICDSMFLYYNSGTPITTAINGGRAWVTYSGHGAEDRWQDPNYTSAMVRQLTNVDKVPLVGTYACLSGNFASTSHPECFSETWIRVGFRGAIAHYASSVTSYWTEDDTLQRRVFDYAFDSNFVWAMGMLNKAKIRYFSQMGNTGMTRRYFEMYNMMGDGAIDVYWNIPALINVTYPAVIPLGSYIMPITVTKNNTPVRNALVCAMAKNDTAVCVSAYTDVNGQVQLPLTNTFTDSIYITVTGHNLATFLGATQARSLAGAYILYLRHLIFDPPPGGNNDSIVNSGESVEMRTWFKNYGNSTANTVRAWLRSADPNITITDSFKSIGNVLAHDSAYTADGFNFSVAPGCTNGYSLRFTLTIKDAQDSTWWSDIKIIVGSPNNAITETETYSPIEHKILFASQPNPFANYTLLSYTLPKSSFVQLQVYDISGKMLKELEARGKKQEAGNYEVRWDGRDNLGQKVADGIYFCRLKTNDQTITKKISIIR